MAFVLQSLQHTLKRMTSSVRAKGLHRLLRITRLLSHTRMAVSSESDMTSSDA